MSDRIDDVLIPEIRKRKYIIKALMKNILKINDEFDQIHYIKTNFGILYNDELLLNEKKYYIFNQLGFIEWYENPNNIYKKLRYDCLSFLEHIMNKKIDILNLSTLYNSLHINGLISYLEHIEVKYLNLSYNNINDDDLSLILDQLKKNNILESLNIAVNHIGPKSELKLVELLKSSTLKYLDISNTSHREQILFFEALKTNITLKSLNLSTLTLRDKCIQELAQFLQINKSLEYLNLSYINYTERREKKYISNLLEIYKSLEINFTLKSLNLSNNNLSHEDFTSLSKLFQKNNTIQHLNLSGNYLNYQNYVDSLYNVISNNNLQYLNLSHMNITSTLCEQLFKKLSSSMVKYLNLSHNYICIEGFRAIYEFLKVDKLLEYLDISHNKISDEFNINIDIFNILKINSTLQYLDISYNNIYEEEIIELFESLKFSNLEYLDVSGNMITDKCLEKLSEILIKNEKLISLSINSSISTNYFYKILESLIFNKTLKYLSLPHKLQINDFALNESFKEKNILEYLNLSNHNMENYEITNIINKLCFTNNLKYIELSKLNKKTLFINKFYM